MTNARLFLWVLAALAYFYSVGDGAAAKTSMLICSAGNRLPTPGDSFTFTNNCPYTIWPGTITSGGDVAQLSSTGFELASETSSSLNVQAPWAGRIWARTFCATNSTRKFNCQTGDCASGQLSCNGADAIPPTTLIEFSLAANNGLDFYDISLVDGFNLPVSITLQGGSGSCNTISCSVDINANCPKELALKNSDGATIGCKGACVALNQPQYCCTGAFASPETCPPTNYSDYFKRNCPLAFSYPYDDKIGTTFSCNGGPKYAITFCP